MTILDGKWRAATVAVLDFHPSNVTLGNLVHPNTAVRPTRSHCDTRGAYGS